MSTTEDPEIKAMAALAEILSGLNADAVERVLRWGAERFRVSLGSKRGGMSAIGEDEAIAGVDFATFFAEASPETESEKVLVAGYWFQQIMGQQDLDAQHINAELRHLGHVVSNITRAFDDLMSQRPQ